MLAELFDQHSERNRRLRRDYSIVLAMLFMGVYHAYAWWICCPLVAYILVAGKRWPWLRSVRLAAGADPASRPGSSLEVDPR